MRKLFAAVALALALPAFAQSYDSALEACRLHSLAVHVDHPGKVMKAQEEDLQRCVTANLPDPQRREDALFSSWSKTCNVEADDAQKLDKLITAAARKEIYTTCMAGHRYIVQ